MKRYLLTALLLIVFVTGSAFAQTTITWSTWLGGDQLDVLQRRIREFERQNPDIKVEILSFAGEDYKAKLLAMMATGTAPDVAHIVVYDAEFFIENGMLYDVTRYAQSINLNDYFITDIFVRDGRVYGGYESHVQVYPVYYNVDAFEEAGLVSPNVLAAQNDWTWDTFVQAIQRLTRIDASGNITQYGLYLHQLWEVGWGIFLLANGASFIDETGTKITIDSPEAMQALEFVRDLYLQHNVASHIIPLPPGDPLLNGSVAMQITGSWNMNHYQQFAGDLLNWDIAVTPRPPWMDADIYYRAPGIDGVVLAGTQHPEEAWRLVEFFLGEYVQMDKARSRLEVPILKEAITSDVYLQGPPDHMRVIGDLLDKSVPPPTTWGSIEVRDTIQEALWPVWAGTISLEEGVRQAKHAAEVRLEEILLHRGF